MTNAMRGFKCRKCREMQTRHTPTVEGFKCPDGAVVQHEDFERHLTKSTRRSMSFSHEELLALHRVFQTVLLGGDAVEATKAPAMRGVLHKVLVMRNKSLEEKRKAA